MFLLGLTGDIACGKSTVARWLMQRGAAHIDADILVRELYADTIFARHLIENLSAKSANDQSADRVLDLLKSDGTMDRAALAQWVFGNEERLKRLEKVVHPAVADLRAQKIESLRASHSLVVLEAVKLVESGQAEVCDRIWWISCRRDVQMRRLVEERGLNVKEAELRLRHQPDEEQKRLLLNKTGIPFDIVDNSDSLRDLEQKLPALWLSLPQTISSQA